jgi:hypothetical protein
MPPYSRFHAAAYGGRRHLLADNTQKGHSRRSDAPGPHISFSR